MIVFLGFTFFVNLIKIFHDFEKSKEFCITFLCIVIFDDY